MLFTHGNWPAFLEAAKAKKENDAPLYMAVFLCARWCFVCRDFFTMCEKIARDYHARHPDTLFLYLDIEDDEAIVGDIDIDDFPTLLVFRNEVPLHFKPVMAREETIIQCLKMLRDKKSGLPLPATLMTLYNTLIHHVISSPAISR